MDVLSFEDFAQRNNGIKNQNDNKLSPESWMMAAQNVFSQFEQAKESENEEDCIKSAMMYVQCFVKGMAEGIEVFDQLYQRILDGIYKGDEKAAARDGLSKEGIMDIYDQQVQECKETIKDHSRDVAEKFNGFRAKNEYVKYYEKEIDDYNTKLKSDISGKRTEIKTEKSGKNRAKLQGELQELLKKPFKTMKADLQKDKDRYSDGFMKFINKHSDFFDNILKSTDGKQDKIAIAKSIQNMAKSQERNKDNAIGQVADIMMQLGSIAMQLGKTNKGMNPSMDKMKNPNSGGKSPAK